MVLLLQSISIEEFIQKDNKEGDNNERFGYRNQYDNEFGRIYWNK